MKKINMSHTLICILALVLSGICYAETYNNYICTVQCSPSSKETKSLVIKGEPNKQYTIATIGMEVKGVGLIVDWEDYLMKDEPDVSIDNTIGYVVAKCEPSNEKTIMYSSIKLGIPAPSLSCPKGKGVLLRFLSPHDQDPDKYIFKYKMTVVQD